MRLRVAVGTGLCLLVLATLNACGGQVMVDDFHTEFEFPPAVDPLPVTVGVHVSEELRSYRHRYRDPFLEKDLDVNVGAPSMAILDQLFAAMFEAVVPLSGRLPSDAQRKRLDAIVEPQLESVRIAASPHGCSVSITYEVSLYTPEQT